VIHVVNQTGAAVIIEDFCWLPGATGIRVDGLEIDDWLQHTCNDEAEGKCQAPDCFGESGIALAPGEIYDASWKGLFKGPYISIPSDCPCGAGATCAEAVIPTTGDHELTVNYQIGEAMPGTGGTGGAPTTSTTFTMTFAFPTSEVTATLMP